MAFEIELKARVDDPAKTRNILSKRGKYCYTCEKDDAYWVFPGRETPRLRLRRENKTNAEGHSVSAALITCKIRETRGGIEINDEQELTISDAPAFEKILTQLGLQPIVRKEKRGEAWQFHVTNGQPSVLAELLEVKNLGWFIELEILSPVHDDQTISAHRKTLLDLLATLDIPQEKIEPRPYTEMLKHLSMK